MASIPPELEELIAEGVIDGVRTRLLSGKEASVFIVERDGEAFAAKVYKGRNQRSFKNVASYLEGRNQTRSSRDRRAQQKKTRYGRELMEADWRGMEHDALQRAFAGGVRVPEPFLLMNDVLVMELVTDEAGHPAPRLADLELDREVAGLLFQEAFLQVRRLLACGLVHGDLSAYNLLLGKEGITIIDLPQVVDAALNSQAASLLHRDLKNLVEHLARFDDRLLRLSDCGFGLWRHYQRGTLDSVVAPEPSSGDLGRRGQRGRGRRGRNVGGGPGGAEGRPDGKRRPQERAAPQIERVGAPARPPVGGGPAPGAAVTKARPPAAGPSSSSGHGPSRPRRRRRRPPRPA